MPKVMTSLLMSSPPISISHRLFRCRYSNSRDAVASCPKAVAASKAWCDSGRASSSSSRPTRRQKEALLACCDSTSSRFFVWHLLIQTPVKVDSVGRVILLPGTSLRVAAPSPRRRKNVLRRGEGAATRRLPGTGFLHIKGTQRVSCCGAH